MLQRCMYIYWEDLMITKGNVLGAKFEKKISNDKEKKNKKKKKENKKKKKTSNV